MTTCEWCIKAMKLQEDQGKLDEQATTMPSSVYVKKSDIIMGLYKSCNEKCKCESSSEEEESEGWRLDDLLEELEVHEVDIPFSRNITYYWDERINDLYNIDGNIVGKVIVGRTPTNPENPTHNKLFNYNDVEWF